MDVFNWFVDNLAERVRTIKSGTAALTKVTEVPKEAGTRNVEILEQLDRQVGGFRIAEHHERDTPGQEPAEFGRASRGLLAAGCVMRRDQEPRTSERHTLGRRNPGEGTPALRLGAGGAALGLMLLCTGIGCRLVLPPVSPVSHDQVSPVSFTADSFWYQPIPDAAELDPDSEAYISAMAAAYRDRLVMVVRSGSVTVYRGGSGTPRGSIPLTGSLWHGDRRIGGLADIPIPDYLLPDPATDGHVAIIDEASGVEIDLWQARMVAGRWVASVAAIVDLESNGVHYGETVRASGFALTAGLIWPQELVGDEPIRHALVLGYAHTRRDSYVAPASWSDGWSTEPFALPMGAHLRLDPSLDLDSLEPALHPFERKVARAMQEYGMYIHDTNSVGSILELEAVNPACFANDPYAEIPGFVEAGYDEGYVTLSDRLVPHFQVLSLPPVQEAASWVGDAPPQHAGYYYYR